MMILLLISPLCLFWEKTECSYNASMFYGLCFDLDYVGVNELQMDFRSAPIIHIFKERHI